MFKQKYTNNDLHNSWGWWQISAPHLHWTDRGGDIGIPVNGRQERWLQWHIIDMGVHRNRFTDWNREQDAYQHVLSYLAGLNGFSSLLVRVAAVLDAFKNTECAHPLAVIPEKKREKTMK